MCACRLQVVVVVALAVSGCASNPARDATRPHHSTQLDSYRRDATKTIYVVGHGWHTGLVLHSRDVTPEVLPGLQYLADTDFVEFGWGDEESYRAKKHSIPLVLRAAFWPTPSVLHVVGFRGPIQRFPKFSDVIEVRLSNDQFQELCRFISDTFDESEDGRAIPLGPGIYGESTFYRAKGHYHFANTCNIWIAQALRQAGCAVTPQLVVTADGVLTQTRKFGHDLQVSPSDVKQVALRGTPKLRAPVEAAPMATLRPPP